MTAQQRPAAPHLIVIAEDSEADRALLIEVFDELPFDVSLIFVGNGEELLDYLRDGGSGPAARRHPVLILLDLNMPRMKGIDALKAMRADAVLCVLPVIALSTSNNPKQIAQAYAHGANAYLTKPGGFDAYVELLLTFGTFWLQSAKLPIPMAGW